MLAGMTFLDEITDAAARIGIAPTTLCQRAVKNAALPKRLAAGGSVTVRTVERVRGWIKVHKPRRKVRQ